MMIMMFVSSDHGERHVHQVCHFSPAIIVTRLKLTKKTENYHHRNHQHHWSFTVIILIIILIIIIIIIIILVNVVLCLLLSAIVVNSLRLQDWISRRRLRSFFRGNYIPVQQNYSCYCTYAHKKFGNILKGKIWRWEGYIHNKNSYFSWFLPPYKEALVGSVYSEKAGKSCMK